MSYRRAIVMVTVLVSVTGLTTAVGTTSGAAAKPAASSTGVNPDPALGNGLGRLLAPTANSARVAHSGPVIDQSRLAIRDSQGRVLVDLTPQAGVDRAAYRAQAAALGFVVTATDPNAGTLEGYTPLSSVRALQALRGTGTLAQALRPHLDTGSVTSQGVAFQRVDKVLANGIDGKGITVGVLSDSYDTATTTLDGDPLTDHAAQDIASGDLPGRGNAQYPQPVVVLQDYDGPDATDEGRAILQIVHDVAPAAKLCFATGYLGDLSYADNIRALADPSGPCKADIVLDDLDYYDEPAYEDGPIAQAVDDVTAQGVSYFSSAGNSGDSGAWQSPLRLLPASAASSTNLNFSDVPADLYSGGLQDMDPGPGTDVAQTLTVGDAGGVFDLQWDDPLDLNGATYGTPYFTASGSLTTSSPEAQFTFTPTSAQLGSFVDFHVDGVPSGSTDVILTVTEPDGTTIGPIDTITSPEDAYLTLNQAGHYRITVDGFDGATGPFTVAVRPVTRSKVTTDLNALFFDADGNYLFTLGEDNTLSGEPSEALLLEGAGQLQLVIARGGTGPTPVTRVDYVLFDDIHQDEYLNPLAPAIYGHPKAAGAIAVAAYDPFRPYLPESFTSVGGQLPILFDDNGNRLAYPDYRLKPDVAATDGGNTTFFVDDSDLDPDSYPNFFGTSAAAPHAAGIAALLLERAGGRRSLTPAQVKQRLQQTAFAHDLDPDHSQGSAGGLTITANGAQGYDKDTVPGSMTDTHFFDVQYAGRVPLKSITLYGETASPTALGTLHPPFSDGIVFDPRPFTGISPFFDQGFPFTIGSTSGLDANSVSARYTAPYRDSGTFRHLTISFAQGLTRGADLTFGVDRDLAQSGHAIATREGNGADELGGAVFIPQGIAVPFGLTFTAVRADGRIIAGVMVNRLGHGFSPVDGFGLINAERAVLGGGR